jgi:predicted nuclease with TOPRIM domain
MDAVRKDAAKVVNENNGLHVQLIRQAENFDAQQTTHYERVKQLENEISELSFWKHQAINRLEKSEKEQSSLKDRLQELLKIGKSAHTSFCQYVT